MSDTLILGIALPVITAISAWVTIWLNGRVAAKLAAQLSENTNKIAEAKEKMDVVEKKLDENHKLNNGNLTKLLETTEKLATAQEKSKHTDKK